MLPFQQDYEDEVCMVDLLLHTILQLELDLYIQLSVINISCILLFSIIVYYFFFFLLL